LLDDQNELQGKIQQLIKNNGKDSADRRLRDGYYAGRLEQLTELWQQFYDLDEEVQQAALPSGKEKYKRSIHDNIPTGSDPPKAPRRTSANIKITIGEQVKGSSIIDTVIRKLQRSCNELESS